MTDRGDEKERPQPTRSSPTLDEGRLFEIIQRLDDGDLQQEEAVRRIMAHYQFAIGVHLRALGEMRPDMVDGVVARLLKDLRATAAAYRPDAPTESQLAETPKPEPARLPVLTGRKSDIGLVRDRLILTFLIGKNHHVALSELSEYLSSREPGLDEGSLIAHLDRLLKAHAISRPRKGHYTSNDSSGRYLAAISAEIERRGISEDVLRRKGA